MIGRGLLAHGVLLAVAAVASVFVWTREKTPVAAPGEVTIWNARAADVERIALDEKGKKVTLEAETDAQGRWFSGTAVMPGVATPDAGSPAPREVHFVSVSQANKVAEGFAPLRGLREIGRIGDDRAAEFGLKEPEGSISVTVAGKERKLTLGARTPGGGDRYVRDDSDIVYVLRGEVTRDLEAGDPALAERDTHGFKDPDLVRVRIVARGKSREILRRGPETKRIWADPSDPEKADETATNWLAKVDRLRPTEFLATEPRGAEPVLRIEYEAKGVQGAFLELAKLPSAQPEAPPVSVAPQAAKPDYVVRTEWTRRWAKVYGPVAEQVEQDLGSVLR